MAEQLLFKQFKKKNYKPDLILSTDMLDLSTFLALTKTKARSAYIFMRTSYPILGPLMIEIFLKKRSSLQFYKLCICIISRSCFI